MGPRAGLDGRKISSPPGFDLRTVQPVAQSLYRLSYPAHMQVQYHTLFDDTASIWVHFRRTVLPFKNMLVQSEIHNTNFSKMNCAVETKLFGISSGLCNAFTWCNIQSYGALTMVYNWQSPLFGPCPSSNFKTLKTRRFGSRLWNVAFLKCLNNFRRSTRSPKKGGGGGIVTLRCIVFNLSIASTISDMQVLRLNCTPALRRMPWNSTDRILFDENFLDI